MVAWRYEFKNDILPLENKLKFIFSHRQVIFSVLQTVLQQATRLHITDALGKREKDTINVVIEKNNNKNNNNETKIKIIKTTVTNANSQARAICR